MFTEYITPRFLETDALGHINNNTYGVWFEAARDEFFRIFVPDSDIKKWNLVIAHSSFDFLKEVFWGKQVIVKTAVSKIGTSSVELSHAVYQDGKLCTTGKCVLIHYDFAQKVSMPIGDDIRSVLEKHIHLDQWNERLEELLGIEQSKN
ncbi:MAG: thioesterase family protein [Arcobacteraceae bacterium]